jgi:hypothetical protein
MMKSRSRAAASIAALAAFSMTAAPALAHGYGDWGRYRGHHHDRIDGGDILAGLLVVGGIAAIASAASKSSRDSQAREPDRYPGGPDYGEPEERGYDEAPDNRPDYPGGAREQGSFDEAANHCADEIERGERKVDTIDNVGRRGDRYEVEGRLTDGRGFACSIDDAGRIRSVAVDGHAVI